MRAILMALILSACGPVDTADAPDAVIKPDALCPGETLFEPFSAADPLYGEACADDNTGCRPNRALPGGFAGACVDGVCRPLCGFYDNGATARQCCLRGGFEAVTGLGWCVCVP